MTPVVRMTHLVALGARSAVWSRTRFAVTVIAEAQIVVACLSAGSVSAIGPGHGGPYSTALLQQGPMRSGLLTGLAVLVVPLLALIGQAAVVGSPARNRRLSLCSLLGTTPAGVRTVIAAEALAPALVGLMAGTAVFALLRRTLDGPLTVRGAWTTTTIVQEGASATTEYSHLHHGWVHVLPTDVLPSTGWFLATVILVPATAVGASWLAAHRVQVDPLRVARRGKDRRSPTAVPVLLLLVSLSGLTGYSLLRAALGQPNRTTQLDVILVVALFATAAASLVLGTASLAASLGQWIAEVSGKPALLIAGRRLESDPYSASRSTSLVLLALVVAVAGQAVKQHFLVITDPEDPSYADTLRLVDVGYVLALAMACAGVVLRAFESISTRHEQFAVLIASGTPISVLRRSVVLETMIPLAPGVVAAAALGLLGVRGVLGSHHGEVVAGANAPVAQVPIPVPWEASALLALGVLAGNAILTALVFGLPSSGAGSYDGPLRDG